MHHMNIYIGVANNKYHYKCYGQSGDECDHIHLVEYGSGPSQLFRNWRQLQMNPLILKQIV